MVSLRRLAELAGVSHVTVLRALRGDARMRPETRQRILELADLYAYQPHSPVPSRERSGLIGILVSDISSPVFSRVLKGALQEAYVHDYRVVTLESHHNLQHVCKAIEVFIDQRVEGLLLAPGIMEKVPLEYLMRLQSAGIHTVIFSPYLFATTIDCVYCDIRHVNDLAVQYLMDLGHRRIAYAGHLTKYSGVHNQDYLTFLEVMRKRRLPEPICYNVHKDSPDVFIKIAKDISQRIEPPTAIVAWNDESALELLNTLTYIGYHIPHDISVLGIGNCWMSDISIPPLSTIEQFPKEIGRRSIEVIANHIVRKDTPSTVKAETITIEPQLVIRKSCAAPPHIHRR